MLRRGLVACFAVVACSAPSSDGPTQDVMTDPAARGVEPAPPGGQHPTDPPKTDDGDPTKGGDPISLLEPKANALLVVGEAARFRAKAKCKDATIELVADGQYVFATAKGPELDLSYALA